MGIDFYSSSIYDCAETIGAVLLARGWTLATAESCTGGGLGHALTAVPGSSSWYLGGLISYSNAFKQQFLQVSETLLSDYGAVSAEVAAAMAEGIAGRGEVALAITGIAGPDGGTAAKPVGLVWLACLDPVRGTRTKRLDLRGSRDQIRQAAILGALEFFLQGLQIN